MQGTFTGRHMLAIMLAFFGVVIAVNVTMAMFAGSSWTGFVVKNSYVASQEFNGKVAAARAQDALGWKADLTMHGGEMRVVLDDKDGHPMLMESAGIVLRNPASDADDTTVALSPSGFGWAAPVAIRDGLWVVEIDLTVPDHAPWRDTRRIHVTGGEIR